VAGHDHRGFEVEDLVAAAAAISSGPVGRLGLSTFVAMGPVVATVMITDMVNLLLLIPGYEPLSAATRRG